MTISEEIKKLETEREIVKNNKFSNPDILTVYDRSIESLKKLLKEPATTTEKKNDSEPSAAEQSAIVKSADAQQQYSTTKPNGNNLDVAVYSVGDDTNSVSDKKWIGKAHKDSFKSISAFNRFMKIKHKLKTMLVNFLKMKDKEFNDASKKNAMTELSQELSRIVKNDVKKEYQKDLLERKFFVKNGKEKVFYGCDETLINNIFKTK